jgi:hypothetical protein
MFVVECGLSTSEEVTSVYSSVSTKSPFIIITTLLIQVCIISEINAASTKYQVVLIFSAVYQLLYTVHVT